MGEKTIKKLMIALDEVRFQMSQTLQASDSLDQKINNSLTVGALILSIFSLTQISF